MALMLEKTTSIAICEPVGNDSIVSLLEKNQKQEPKQSLRVKQHPRPPVRHLYIARAGHADQYVPVMPHGDCFADNQGTICCGDALSESVP